MLGIFISSLDEKNMEFGKDFISLVEVSSTNSQTVMCAIEKVLYERHWHKKKKSLLPRL